MKSKALLLFIILSFSNFTFSQDTKSQGVLDKLSIKMKALKSFYLEFNAIVKNVDSGINENQNGNGWVKGNKYNATYAGNTIISNGMKTWTIIKEDKTVYESDANDDNDGINPKKIMTIWETGFKNKFEKEDVLNGEKVYVIFLYPKDPKKVDYHTIILYISKDGLELKKSIVKTKDGSVMTYSMNKLTENPIIDDTKFVIDLKKYPGYQIVKD
jgi:outer membrane lipoprotein-sorting protein